jgi:hypothetical protein
MHCPEPKLSAYLNVLYHAINRVKLLSYADKPDVKQIADLMDAVHNLPRLLIRWDLCDEDWLLEYLSGYYETWRGRDGIDLVGVFRRTVEDLEKGRELPLP